MLKKFSFARFIKKWGLFGIAAFLCLIYPYVVFEIFGDMEAQPLATGIIMLSGFVGGYLYSRYIDLKWTLLIFYHGSAWFSILTFGGQFGTSVEGVMLVIAFSIPIFLFLAVFTLFLNFVINNWF